MDQKERLEMVLGMRPSSTNFDNLFNDDYAYDKKHPDKIYICWTCERWFTLRDTLKVHLKTKYHKRHLIKNELGEPNDTFLCPCGGKYIKKHKIRHEKSIIHKRYIQNKK